MNQPSTPNAGRSLVPQEPLFSLATLAIRSGSREAAAAECLDFFWARNAIFHGLRALGILPGQKILVPAYLCTAAIEPIEFYGAEVEFYSIRRNCEPDWTDLETKIRGNVRGILAVHYFGFPCNMERFCELRDRYGLLLIEDCAHVLEGVPSPYRLGELGDFSVFSPRKFVPVFDGGVLRLNRPAPGFHVRFQSESPLFTLRVAKNLFERRKPPPASLAAPPPPNPESVEASVGPVLATGKGPEKPLHVFPNSTSFLPWMADFPMSRLSRYLLRRFPIRSMACKRRANYHYLLEKISSIQGVRLLYRQLAPDIVPWVFPLTIGDRTDAHTRLRALGIPAVTWGGVRDPRISPREFPEADFLYEHLVFLPIHQDLETAHLDLIADAIATLCRTFPEC